MSKFETLRREIKADVKKQHDLYVSNLVGYVKANPRDFYRYINGQMKRQVSLRAPYLDHCCSHCILTISQQTLTQRQGCLLTTVFVIAKSKVQRTL